MATTTRTPKAVEAPPMDYQQAMNSLKSIVVASPQEDGIVMLKPGQLTRVSVQAGQHYQFRKSAPDGTLQTPDNVVAVRNADALHLRYADGSTASLESFFSVCTNSSVCSITLPASSPKGMTLGAAEAQSGPVSDDGLLVYAHGNQNVLMAMAQNQPSLQNALRALDDMPTLTYPGPQSYGGLWALAALGLAAEAGSHHGSGTTAGKTPAQTALETISAAAQNNSTSTTAPGEAVYAAANVTGVNASNLASINSALNSVLVTGAQADTTPEVQAIVDAYNAILASADGVADNTATALTGAQYSAIGVTGVGATATAGTALYLLNNTIDAIPRAGVATVAEVQTLADAAAHVMAAAGGTLAQARAVTALDLTALGMTGVTAANLVAVQAAVQAATPDSAVDTRTELQALVNTAIAGIPIALNTIAAAAQANNATATSPAVAVYAAASVSGVDASNLASISSALNSSSVDSAAADTTPEVQAIVDAYQAVLTSADAVAGNTTLALTGTQYTAIGVNGISGTVAVGTALFLLDNVVDASSTAAVDTVAELQLMADAANHVMAAAGGTGAQAAAITLADLSALGIVGVTAANLATVQTAIQGTAQDTAIDTQAELQAVVNTATGAAVHAVVTSALNGVTNLEVSSNLVLSASQTVTVGTGFIHITDLGGPGYQGDTSTNTQNINVATAVQSGLLSITGTGANTKIVINPQWDLDLASNYQLTIDNGAFLEAGNVPITVGAINFSTVTPGTHTTGTAATEAVASQTMVDATGALTAGKSWINIQGLGSNTGPVTQLGDLAGGAYALVMKNYATTRGGDPASGGNGSDGIATRDTNVGVVNFGNNDIVYFDSQINNSAIQFFDARYTGMTDGAGVGGLLGQNTLVMGLVSTPAQQGSTAMILLGLEGNTNNQIYSAIESLPNGTVGWANVWHNTSAPVVMG